MRTVVIASLKGGTGKSTICACLAVEAEKQGRGPVALIDTDSQQGSLSHWWNSREAETPQLATLAASQLKEGIGQLEDLGINLAFVDTPSVVMTTITPAIHAADLVLIPVRPSPNDLRVVGETLTVAEQARIPFCFVINGATPRTHIAHDTRTLLSRHGDVAPVIIHNRVDFALSMADGRTVSDAYPSSKSAQEITELWSHVAAILRK